MPSKLRYYIASKSTEFIYTQLSEMCIYQKAQLTTDMLSRCQ